MSRSASESPRSTSGRDRVGAAWSLEGGRVHDRRGNAVLDLTAPATGLVTTTGDRLLGFDVGEGRPPIDAWVRGDDVTAIWEPEDERGLRATGLWRAIHTTVGIAAWELVASATTRLLRADATLEVISTVSAVEILFSICGPGAPIDFTPAAIARPTTLLARRGDGRSTLLMLHPSEPRAMTVDRDRERVRVGGTLFPAGVEKGVLLRGRALAAVGPSADDVTWGARMAAAFAVSPPLLST